MEASSATLGMGGTGTAATQQQDVPEPEQSNSAGVTAVLRQFSYMNNINYGGGHVLPLRLPSGLVGAEKRGRCCASLEAGTTLRYEAAQLLKLAGPLLIEGVTNIGTQVVATTCVARLGGGPLALGALVLAQTQLNFSYSVICGMASAMETCCGQAFGARQYHLLGLMLQCAQVLCLSISLPAVIAWASGAMGPLLTWLGQPPDVAAAAGSLLSRIWPVLPLLTVSETTGQYLLAQGVAVPASLAGTMMLMMAAPTYWMIIRWLGWLPGVAYSQVGLQSLAVAVVVAWRVARDTWLSRQHPERATWGGWSLHALKGLPAYAQFAVPAACMLCLEWWIWETVVFLAGLLPQDDAPVQLGAMGFVMQLSILTWTLSYSVGTGAATRIANALGARQALNARRIFRLACSMLLCVNVCVAATVWVARRRLTSLLTPDEAVASAMMRILPAAILGVIGDGQVAVLGGLLRAAGRQYTGACLHVITYWLIGLPLGCVLGFKAGMGALGLWMGVASATALQAVALHVWVALRLDWRGEVLRSHATLQSLLGSHPALSNEDRPGSGARGEGGGEEDGGAEDGGAEDRGAEGGARADGEEGGDAGSRDGSLVGGGNGGDSITQPLLT